MPTVTIRLNANVVWTAVRDPEAESWVGICDALKLTARGDTQLELVQSIAEIQDALFLDIMEENDLSRFLRDHGWRALDPLPERPRGRVRFDVPITLAPMPNMAVA